MDGYAMICEWNEYSFASGTSEDNMLRYNLKHEWEGKKKNHCLQVVLFAAWLTWDTERRMEIDGAAQSSPVISSRDRTHIKH